MPPEIHWAGSQRGFTHAELTEAIEGAAAAWTQAGPCALQVVAIEDEEADAHFEAGGIAVILGDSHNLIDGSPAYVVFTTNRDRRRTATWGGVDYQATMPAEIAYSDTTDFLPETTIVAGACADESSLQSAITRQIGRLLGLGDSAVFEATMHPDLPDCDTSRSTLAPDDIEGLEAIYGDGASVAFSCDSADDDPLAVSCEVTEPADPPETAEDSGAPADPSTPDVCGCAAGTPESATSIAALLSVLMSRRRRRGTG